ncbi:hypothetical protein [Actinoalloteichus caeruleus]
MVTPDVQVDEIVTMLIPRLDARPASRVRRYAQPRRSRRVRPFLKGER